MSEGDSAAVERIIANTIKETARGDPDALASRIVAALAEAGFLIVSASGRENTARTAFSHLSIILRMTVKERSKVAV